MPLRFLVACRRILYFQTILKRDDKELTKQVLLAQTDDPYNGDFFQLVENDCKNLSIDINNIENQSKQTLKKLVKQKAREAALKQLLEMKNKHSKVSNLKYSDLAPQKYLKSILFTNDEAKLLFDLLTRTSKYFKSNFMSLTATHPVFSSCGSSPYEVAKAKIQARCLSGRA